MHNENFLPEPDCCDVCQYSVTFIETPAHFAKGRMLGMWKCRNSRCRALVSCHQGTKNPVGYMANDRIRRLRSECHKVFDLLWSVEESRWTRQTAYLWMAELLNIPRSVANISKLTEEQMLKVMDASKLMYREHVKLLDDTKRQARKSSKDRRMRDQVIRQQQRKPNVKINTRNYDNYV